MKMLCSCHKKIQSCLQSKILLAHLWVIIPNKKMVFLNQSEITEHPKAPVFHQCLLSLQQVTICLVQLTHSGVIEKTKNKLKVKMQESLLQTINWRRWNHLIHDATLLLKWHQFIQPVNKNRNGLNLCKWRRQKFQRTLDLFKYKINVSVYRLFNLDVSLIHPVQEMFKEAI